MGYLYGDLSPPPNVYRLEDPVDLPGRPLPRPAGHPQPRAEAVAGVDPAVLGGSLGAGDQLILIGVVPRRVVPPDAEAPAPLPHSQVDLLHHRLHLILSCLPPVVPPHNQVPDVSVAHYGDVVGAEPPLLYPLHELPEGVPVYLPSVHLPVDLVHPLPRLEPLRVVHVRRYPPVYVP